MDPLAHTLVGATLAQTQLKRLTPLAAPTLILAANLPDIDAIAMFLSSDEALYHRRGITHGLLALVILPWMLALAMTCWNRYARKTQEQVNFKGLLILSYVGIFTHPFLDWLNTYGIRLLMPFSNKWFYGDTLFIVDPWLWLLMAVAVVVAARRSKTTALGWIALALATSVLIAGHPIVPVFAKVTWFLGLTLMAFLKFRNGISSLAVANKSLVALTIYLALMFYGNSRAQSIFKKWLGDYNGSTSLDVMTGPYPANPFARQIVAATATQYFGLKVDLISGHTEQIFDPVEITELDEIVKMALAEPEVKGFVGWMRFPYFEVKEHQDFYEVILRDLRYVRPDQVESVGIGMARVQVPRVSI